MIDVDACRRRLQQRREARLRANRRLWEQAHADADRLIRHIAQTCRPDRILQWGSVLHPDRFGPRSDIDIAIDGDLTPEAWFRLLGELWTMTRFPVDIVDLRRIEPEFADIIRAKGRVAYARRPLAH